MYRAIEGPFNVPRPVVPTTVPSDTQIRQFEALLRAGRRRMGDGGPVEANRHIGHVLKFFQSHLFHHRGFRSSVLLLQTLRSISLVSTQLT